MNLLTSLPAQLRITALLPALAVPFLAGCGGSSQPATTTTTDGRVLTQVRLQSDWYPQAEHGGYYQALTKGFYAEAGLAVEILGGGPGSFGTQRVVTGQAEFSMGRSDDLMLAVQEGLPLVIVSALMQHDPQALLLHASNPVNSFAGLNGKTVMMTPGSAWVKYVERSNNITLNVIPLNYGLAQFMADPHFIQQCFVTNEPYFVRQNGGNPKTLLVADSGYDPYRVIFTSTKFAREHPALVRAFVAASIRGWDDFMNGDPAPGKALIASRNESMTSEFMDYSIAAMRERQLVTGNPAAGERIGLLKRGRMQRLSETLHSLGVLPEAMPLERYVRFDFLPEELAPLTD
jgi:NitT/TauT family transport system substrate-binding protein